MILTNRLFNQLNLYERNIYKYLKNNIYVLKEDNTFNEVCCFLYAKLNRLFLHKVFINYIEVPITTKCSLRCKECSNLIQFYDCGEFLDADNIVRDVKKFCNSVEGIDTLRILGGEPLLHPELEKIIIGILKNKNINNIQIVTNGTMLFKKEVLSKIRNRRVSVDISNYGSNSRKHSELVNQLKMNNIKFIIHKQLNWTRQSDCTFRKRSEKDLNDIMKNCKMDCISLFKGKIHLCPRSAHGEDLNLFITKKTDVVNIANEGKKGIICKKIFKLLNNKTITACNYCDVFRYQELEECEPGEQVSREEAINTLIKIKEYNAKLIK